MKRIGASLLLFALFGTVAPCAFALDPSRPLRRFQRKTWGTEQGLPHDGIMTLAQTTDGYLWFATLKGLARFDGVNFTVFDGAANFTPEPVGDLAAGPNGDLWIAHTVLSHYANGKFTTWGVAAGLHDGLRQIRRARDGTIWGISTKSLIQFDGKRFRAWGAEAGLPEGGFCSITIDTADHVWVATLTGGVFMFDGRRFTRLTTREGLPSNEVASVYAEEAGGIWMSSGDPKNATVHRTADGQLQFVPLPGYISLIDRRGAIWTLGTKSIYRSYGGKVVSLTPSDGLSGEYESLFEDRDGNIWISTLYNGAIELIDSTFTNYTTADGLSTNTIIAVLQDSRGTIWTATSDGAVASLGADDRFHQLATGSPWPSARALAAGSDGTVWITGENGVATLRDGHFKRVLEQAMTTLSIWVTRAGQTWIGSYEKGVIVLDHGRVVKRINLENGLADNFVRCVRELADGSMIIGMGAGAQIYREGKLSARLRLRGTMKSADQDRNGTIWMAMEGHGIARLRNGAVTELESSAGIANASTLSIIDDGAGSLWLSTMTGGVFRYDKNEFDAVAEGRASRMHPRAFGTEDGMGSRYATFGSPSSIRASDGSLWFATSRGLSMVRPDRIGRPGAPPTVIESIAADGSVISEASPRIAAGTQRVTIRFTSPSIADAERTTFEYKLEPFDDKWSDAGVRRVVEYTNLPPGSYRFRVLARNHEGLPSAKPATLTFHVEPKLWQTVWFRILLVTLCVAISAAAILSVIRASRSRERRFSAEIGERTTQLQSTIAHLEASNREFVQSASSDKLTGVGNRRAFEEIAAASLRNAARDSTPLTIAIVAVDHFAAYHALHGRRRADVCLRQIADVLRQGTAGASLVARYESEEFAILFSNTGVASVSAIATKLEFAIAALRIPRGSVNEAPFVSISIGIALARPDDDPDALMARADAARRIAKPAELLAG